MNQFIEVTVRGQRVLVNLDHVEEIREGYGECVIYYAFNSSEAVEQNYIKPDQSYDEVIGRITDIGRYKPQLASDDVGKISAVELLTAAADICKNHQEGSGISIMSNRPDCGHETYKEELNL